MSSTKPSASLSLDLDNQWAYMRVHGDAGWEDFPSYFDRVMPRILATLGARKLRITVFVVGQDAALAKNRAALAAIASAGHEIGNHSFHHSPAIAGKSEAELHQELEQAEQSIAAATGQRPAGYRAPAFALSPATLSVLQQRGYCYDASTFPTVIGPLARAYYLSTVRRANRREEQESLYGGWKEALRPLRPHWLNLPSGNLLEIPITTFPGIRTPIHLTYLLFLCQHSPRLARAYFRAALWNCRQFAIPPSLLLHPLDFLGADDVPELSFFPGMKLSGKEKTAFVGEILDLLCARYEVMGLRDLGDSLAAMPPATT